MSDKALTFSRQGDRAKVICAIGDLADRYGVRILRKPLSQEEVGSVACKNCEQLNIVAPCGLQGSVTVAPRSRSYGPGIFVPWHISWDFTSRMAASVFPSRNPHHRQKSSEVYSSVEVMLNRFEQIFRAAADGTAFEAGSVSRKPMLADTVKT